MKNKQGFFCLCAVLCVLLFFTEILAQSHTDPALTNIFNKAMIRMDNALNVPLEIRFRTGESINVNTFFDHYRQAFAWGKDNQARKFRSFSDELGQTHYRFKQYYKDVELAEVQYLLHERDGSVFYAHGRLIHGMNMEVKPTLSEEEALSYALHNINAQSYMWENPKQEAILKKAKDDMKATYYPAARLMISAGHKEKIAANFRLVYRFDVFAEQPISRYYVDVDAHSGEIIAKFSRINDGDVLGEGMSLYNGMVPIVVSDSDFPTWLDSVHCHLSDWNAYGGIGESWWVGDPTLGNEGGYENSWYEIIDTDTITLTGTNPKLTFYHRFAVEPIYSWGEYDGFDGINVRISSDGGQTWQVLLDPTPAYTCSSLVAFSIYEDMETGIPGWAGNLINWTPVTFDLSSFTGQVVQIRFAFASDYSLSSVEVPELFGWQIDDIVVSTDQDTLFFNNGVDSGLTFDNITREVTYIEGNYRLRESGSGGGIFTYNSMEHWNYATSVDFVDEDSSFTDPEDAPGVQTHWGLESTYDYYLIQHGRHSYDDSDGRLIGYVNQIFFRPDGTPYPNNAMWTGSALLFGAGDSTNFDPFTSLDVVGHEFTHGVTQYSAELIYENQPGALNESFSDIFGAAVEFYKEGSVADWLMGEDFCPQGWAIRSLENPNFLENPDTYGGDYWVPYEPEPTWENDFGGVHTNCGVQNYWFYLLCEGGSGINDDHQEFSVTGIGIEDAEQIAYRNLSAYLMPTSGFAEARLGAINAAIDLFGNRSLQVQSVVDAWNAVGVYYPFVGPYAQNCILNEIYQTPGVDTLKLVSEIINPENHNVQVFSIIESFDHNYLDSLEMLDDGLHNDGSAGDGKFGSIWPVLPDERSYHVHLTIESLDSGYYNIMRDIVQFTTIGPVVFEEMDFNPLADTTYNPGNLIAFRMWLKNTGSIATATDIHAEISSPTPLITIPARNSSFGFNNMDPDMRSLSYGYYSFTISETITRDTLIYLPLTIYSEDYPLWYDSLEVAVWINALDDVKSVVPDVYALQQNHPNPFNPVTKINYQLPIISEVDLSIYNLLGQKIASLVNERQQAGFHQVEWDATGFSSGIYYYRLEAGKFIQTRKMIYLK